MNSIALRSMLAALLAALASPALAEPDAPAPPVVDLAKQPTLYVVGYAHLDTQWRWCYPQSIRDFLPNTLHENFALFEKYPHYVFNFSGSRRYQMMREYYPADFEKLKAYIAAGRWFPCGSSVDENDANVPSAESLVRQVLYGNQYFRKEFGKASDEFMLPDCFGFPAALPSVLAHCGIKGFSTQKLTWGSAVGIPFKVGIWTGPDGRGVLAALDPGAYVGEVRSDLSVNDSWRTRVENNGKLSGVYADYHYYGAGDQGGGPTDESVANIEKSVLGNGPLKVISGPADWMFNAITPEMQAKLPRYSGELLLTQHSAGSITSQASMKRWNRKNELLADAAEKAAVAAWWLGAPYPARQIEEAWTLVLGSQMHDILPGTSHPKAYEYAWNDELLAANMFESVLTDSVGAVSSQMDTRGDGTAVVVFNPLSTEREDVMELTLPWPGDAAKGIIVTGPDGKPAPFQVLDSSAATVHIAVLAKAPSVGFAVFHVKPGEGAAAASNALSVTERSLENARYRVKLDDNGDIASILDKSAEKELLAAPARLGFHYEKPAQWPAWNMDWKDRQQPARSYVTGPATFRIVERGPVRVALEVTRESEGSTFVQTIRLGAGEAGDRVEVANDIDWTTRERSLKATFPLAVSNPKAAYDLQVGAIERTNNDAKHYENPSHLWFDLTDRSGNYGVTVMNDSKFGSDKPDDSTLRLTLLYTPGVSGDYQDQGTQDIGRHHILYALEGHGGSWAAAGTPWTAARLNQPLQAFIAPPHAGPLGRSFSMFSASSPSVMISAVKKAEDSEKVVLRLRELTGSPAAGVKISSQGQIIAATEIDGQERPLGEAKAANGSLETDMHGYGLHAFAITPGRPPATIAAAGSKPLVLPFDADVISLNSARNDGSIDAKGRTYPGEQLGAMIEDGDAVFKLGSGADGQKNALLCRGQTIALPAGDFNRLELLAASAGSDQNVEFQVDGKPVRILVPSWQGYIGQWDNRVWTGTVPEIAYNWSATYGGLEPGYVKPCRVAWYCSHHHTPKGDQYYEYSYLFRISLDLPAGAKSLRLPDNSAVMILAATAMKAARDQAKPAAPLFDTLDDRTQDAPRIGPGGGSFADAIEVMIEPRLYGRADSIRYTLDGSDPTPASPKYAGPLAVNHPSTIRAAIVGPDGKIGPMVAATLEVNDKTPPQLLKAQAAFNQPTVRIDFSEPLDAASAQQAANYAIEPAITVTKAALVESGRGVVLTLAAPLQQGTPYVLRIGGIGDDSPAHNKAKDLKVKLAAPAPVFRMAEVSPAQRGVPISNVKGVPTRGGDPWTLNMFVRTEKDVPNRTVIAGFGALPAKADGGARYICKFGSGVHFWSHHCDLEGNSPLGIGNWQMLTATYDGSMLRLYQDGKLLGEREASMADDAATVNIAPPDPWENQRRFEGEIRELTIWDVALDAQAVQSLKSGMPGR